MVTAPVLSTAVPASADDRETACRGQTAHLVEKGFRPMNGLLALGQRPAGVVAVTAISALLSRISGSTQLGFGDYLRDLCDLAALSGRSGGPKLTCAAADATLPIGAAITLGLIADLLMTNAFLYAFPPGQGGGIAVSFAAAQEAWLLTVEDSGIAMRARASRRDNGLMIARPLIGGARRTAGDPDSDRWDPLHRYHSAAHACVHVGQPRRAILKATDVCATEPKRAARQLVEGGFAQNYDYALQVLTLRYNAWRELDRRSRCGSTLAGCTSLDNSIRPRTRSSPRAPTGAS